jgi:hypothetical protein
MAGLSFPSGRTEYQFGRLPRDRRRFDGAYRAIESADGLKAASLTRCVSISQAAGE